jgi:hypothetical protein
MTQEQVERGIQACLQWVVSKEMNEIRGVVKKCRELLDELDSTEEQPDEEVGRTSVEERAKLFFDEITDRFVPAWGKTAERNKREMYRYIASRSLELEAEAVEEAVKELTEERDTLMGVRNDLEGKIAAVWGVLGGMQAHSCDSLSTEVRSIIEERDELLAKRDELKAKLEKADCGKDKTCPKYLGELIAGTNKLWMKAQIEHLVKERDELKAKLDEIEQLVKAE